MDKIQEFIETKLPLYLWAGLGCMCLAGVVFAGAWWHLLTTAICVLMFTVQKAENGRQKEQNES